MPNGDFLTPQEAACIATNSYFALKGWIDKEPRAGIEARTIIQNRVLGSASIGSPSHMNTSLKGTSLQGGTLSNTLAAKTGFGTESGFGYTLTYQTGSRKHLIIATRGTRPELGKFGGPDILTDLKAYWASFGSYGRVHGGFKESFDSIFPSLNKDDTNIQSADVIHCVGHSLGGAVATLIAAHYAESKNVKLYTFGSPRVGLLDTHINLEKNIGIKNIFRVAHDLDPITLIAPYPYIHVLPKCGGNNMTLTSPTGQLFSTANHDMAEYISSIGDMDWKGLKLLSNAVNYSDSVIARWAFRDDADNGWVSYGCKKALALLIKLFRHVLRTISKTLEFGLTAIDLLAEILYEGLHKMANLGQEILRLLGWAAQWAGIKATEVSDFTAAIIKAILDKMLSALKSISIAAIEDITKNINPITIGIAGGFILTSATAF